MAKSIGTLKAMLVLDSKGFIGGFASAGKAANTFIGGIGSKFATSMGGMGAQLGAAAAGVLSVGSAIRNLSSGMEQVDRHAKLADRLGITVAEVQKLALAADLAGTDVEVLARGMLKMGKNIGSGGMTLDKRLFSVADSLAKVTDAGKRGAMAEEIFGRGGLEIINVLIQGSRGIRGSADAIDRFGLAMTRVDAAKIEAANDAWTEMKTVVGGLRNQIAVELSPTITGFVTTWLMGVELLIKRHQDLAEVSRKAAQESGNTFMDYIGAAYASNPLSANWGPLLDNMRQQREDVARNMMNAGRQSGAGLLGKGLSGGKASNGKMFSAALERGSVEASSAITKAGGNPLADAMKPAVDKLTLIERNTAAAARRASGTPLRASNLRGGGAK